MDDGDGADPDADFSALLAKLRDGGPGAPLEAELQQEIDSLEQHECAARLHEMRLRRFQPDGAAGDSMTHVKHRLETWRQLLAEQGAEQALRVAALQTEEHRKAKSALQERVSELQAKAKAEKAKRVQTERQLAELEAQMQRLLSKPVVASGRPTASVDSARGDSAGLAAGEGADESAAGTSAARDSAGTTSSGLSALGDGDSVTSATACRDLIEAIRLEQLLPDAIDRSDANTNTNAAARAARAARADPAVARGVQSLRASLGRALEKLARDLYSSSAHCLAEILQNADDNSYRAGVIPTLALVLRPGSVTTINNETGFSDADVRALCDVGASTKGAGAIGRKGIGFKSVFMLSDTPYVRSGGFSFGFDVSTDSCDGLFGFIAPKWVAPAREVLAPTLATQSVSSVLREMLDLDHASKTIIHLPHAAQRARSPRTAAIATLVKYALSLNPATLLFLRHLRRFTVHSVSETGRVTERTLDASSQVIPDAQASAATDTANESGACGNEVRMSLAHVRIRQTVRNSGDCEAAADGSKPCTSALEHLHEYRVMTQQLRVPAALQSGDYAEVTNLSLAFPTSGAAAASPQRVFAFLPVCPTGLPFSVNADWRLVASRQRVRDDCPRNRWLRDSIATAFVRAMSADPVLRDRLAEFVPAGRAVFNSNESDSDESHADGEPDSMHLGAHHGESENNEDEFWRPVAAAVRRAVQRHCCLRAESGALLPLQALVLRPRELPADALSNDALRAATQPDSREFVHSDEVARLGERMCMQLGCSALKASHVLGIIESEHRDSLLPARPLSWFNGVYAFFGRCFERMTNDELVRLHSAHIFRILGSSPANVNGDDCGEGVEAKLTSLAQGIIYSAIEADAAPTRAETMRLAECAGMRLLLPGTAARPSAARHFLQAVGIHRATLEDVISAIVRTHWRGTFASPGLAWGGISFIRQHLPRALRCIPGGYATLRAALCLPCIANADTDRGQVQLRTAADIYIGGLLGLPCVHCSRQTLGWQKEEHLRALLGLPHGESAHATGGIKRAQAQAQTGPVQRGDWPARLRATSGLIVTTHMTAAEGGWSHNSGQRVLESRVRYGHGYQISRTEQCGARDNAWRTTIASAGATARFRFEARLSGRGVTTESERIAAMGLVVLGVCAQPAALEDTSEGADLLRAELPPHPSSYVPSDGETRAAHQVEVRWSANSWGVALQNVGRRERDATTDTVDARQKPAMPGAGDSSSEHQQDPVVTLAVDAETGAIQVHVDGVYVVRKTLPSGLRGRAALRPFVSLAHPAAAVTCRFGTGFADRKALARFPPLAACSPKRCKSGPYFVMFEGNSPGAPADAGHDGATGIPSYVPQLCPPPSADGLDWEAFLLELGVRPHLARGGCNARHSWAALSPSGECAICMGPLVGSFSQSAVEGGEVRAPPCGHSFHARCIERWMAEQRVQWQRQVRDLGPASAGPLSITCPVCRIELAPGDCKALSQRPATRAAAATLSRALLTAPGTDDNLGRAEMLRRRAVLVQYYSRHSASRRVLRALSVESTLGPCVLQSCFTTAFERFDGGALPLLRLPPALSAIPSMHESLRSFGVSTSADSVQGLLAVLRWLSSTAGGDKATRDDALSERVAYTYVALDVVSRDVPLHDSKCGTGVGIDVGNAGSNGNSSNSDFNATNGGSGKDDTDSSDNEWGAHCDSADTIRGTFANEALLLADAAPALRGQWRDHGPNMLEQDKRAAFYRAHDVVWSAATPREGTGVPTTLALLRRAQLGSRFGGLRNFFVDRVGISPSPTVGDCCEALRKLRALVSQQQAAVTTVKRTSTLASCVLEDFESALCRANADDGAGKGLLREALAKPPPAPAPVLPLPATCARGLSSLACPKREIVFLNDNNYLASRLDQMRGTLPPRFLDVAALLQSPALCSAIVAAGIFPSPLSRCVCCCPPSFSDQCPLPHITQLCRRFVQMQHDLAIPGLRMLNATAAQSVQVVHCTNLMSKYHVTREPARGHDNDGASNCVDNWADAGSGGAVLVYDSPSSWVTHSGTLFIEKAFSMLSTVGDEDEAQTAVDLAAVANALAEQLIPIEYADASEAVCTDVACPAAILEALSQDATRSRALQTEREQLAIRARCFLEEQTEGSGPEREQQSRKEEEELAGNTSPTAVGDDGDACDEQDGSRATDDGHTIDLVPPWDIGLPPPPAPSTPVPKPSAANSCAPPPPCEQVAFEYLSRTLPRFGLRNWRDSAIRREYVGDEALDREVETQTVAGGATLAHCSASERGWAFEYDDTLGLLSGTRLRPTPGQGAGSGDAADAATSYPAAARATQAAAARGWGAARRPWLISAVALSRGVDGRQAFSLSASELGALERCAGENAGTGFLVLFVAGDAVVGASRNLLELLGDKLALRPDTFAALLTV